MRDKKNAAGRRTMKEGIEKLGGYIPAEIDCGVIGALNPRRFCADWDDSAPRQAFTKNHGFGAVLLASEAVVP